MKPTLNHFFTKAKKMAESGDKKQILNFTLTSPEFPPPIWVKNEINKVYNNSFSYLPSGGDFILRQELANFYSDKWNKNFKRENVFIGTGGKEVIYILLSSLLEKPGEVVIISPYWASYPKMTELLKGKVKIVRTFAKKGFYPDMEKIAEAIGKKTKAVIINSPNNPTGRILKEKDVKFLADLALKKNFILICDEVYEIYDYENLYVSALKFFNKNVFCVFSISKTFGLCGWRLGWAIAGENITKKMIDIQSEITTCANALSQLVFRNLYKNPKKLNKYFLENKKLALERRNFAIDFFEKKHIDFIHPEGCIAIFIKIPKKFKNGFSFASHLLEKQGVSTAPGEIFGEKNYFRVNLAVSLNILKKGLDIISKYY